MHDIWMRSVENPSHRVTGPMKLRLILQPVMALIFATIAGLKDAKAGKGPYFWRLFSDPRHLVALLKDGWKSVGKVLILAIVPYFLVRGTRNPPRAEAVNRAQDRR